MTFKTILIYVIYFSAAIFGFWMEHYFKQFTLYDFKRDRGLNRKRKFGIVYAWCFAIISIWIFGAVRDHDIDDIFLGFSSFFLSVCYAFTVINTLEVPKQYHQPKKRKLKYKKNRL
jgi:hypothetical protein